MEMPKPGPGHARLEQLAGTWEGEETMHPSQWDPKGGTATGRTTSRLDLNGFAVVSDYRQERDGRVTFAGHSVTTYNPEEDLYTMHWFDSMGSPPEVFKGGFDGDVMTMQSNAGPEMHARMTWDLSEAGSMKARMEMSRNGKDWNPMFEAKYLRK